MSDKDEYKKGPLPVSDEDLSGVYSRGGLNSNNRDETSSITMLKPISYPKLFLTIIIAAPVAAILSMASIDLYEKLAPEFGLAPVKDIPVELPTMDEAPPEPEVSRSEPNIEKLVAAIEKSNKELATAISKLAERETVAPTIEVKAPKTSSPRVIVVKVPTRESFSLAYEKQKILQLAGIDIDDPVTSVSAFSKVTSRSVMNEVIRSFDAIAAHKNSPEVDSFMLNNVLSAKKYARQRARKLR